MKSRLKQVAGCSYVGEGQPGVCVGNVLGILTMTCQWTSKQRGPVCRWPQLHETARRYPLFVLQPTMSFGLQLLQLMNNLQNEIQIHLGFE